MAWDLMKVGLEFTQKLKGKLTRKNKTSRGASPEYIGWKL
jgi:hypothetical protein